MNRVHFIILLNTAIAWAQDVDLPVPKPKPTPVPVVTEKPEEPTPTPSPVPITMFVTPPPVQQAVVPTLVPLPQPPPTLLPVPVNTPSPVPIRLYKVGSFPAGPRIKPAQVRTQGRVGSWLIGKFVVLSQEDDHHYTCQSHVDSIGIGIVDLANHIGGGQPIILKLYLVDPPAGGLPREFSYGPDAPLRITGFYRLGVSVEDLLDR